MIAPEYATRMPGYISATLPSLSKTVRENTPRAEPKRPYSSIPSLKA
ncbi:predicted protein [Botrytis cinerea T4]|uniref:Uncharacterized protein n=1 Tax=Botryotinia fuckeliana (strain T4) TaxID=999810 RepID=G2YDS7_BOTF4|nr:predicted protein [Botrytis cinerea T4]